MTVDRLFPTDIECTTGLLHTFLLLPLKLIFLVLIKGPRQKRLVSVKPLRHTADSVWHKWLSELMLLNIFYCLRFPAVVRWFILTFKISTCSLIGRAMSGIRSAEWSLPSLASARTRLVSVEATDGSKFTWADNKRGKFGPSELH